MSSNLLESERGAARKSSRGEPTWEIAGLYPRQGEWTEAEYLTLSTNHPVELSEGCVEFLPMPTVLHQAIVGFLFRLLERFVEQHRLGRVFFAPMPVRLGPNQYREPDVVFLRPERLRPLEKIGLMGHPEGADLVIEVLSPGEENRHRDLVEKRDLYAKAGIPEYWIVDPESQRVCVLVLDQEAYRVHGDFGSADRATSLVLTGFEVSLRDLFAVAGTRET